MIARLHVQRWRGSEPAKEGEIATALLHGQLELDGQFVTNGKVRLETAGGEVVILTAQLLLEHFEVVCHSEETWKELPGS